MAKKNGHPVDRWHKEKAQILEFRPNLLAFAMRLCNDRVSAEDLVQETILRAYTHIDSFTPGTRLGAWLFTILRNFHRSEWRKRRREVEDVDGAYSKTLTTASDVEDSNELDRVAMGIACLPREQADAVMLIGYLGYSYTASAEVAGCAEGTIKSRVNRARDALAHLLVDGEFVNVDVEPLKHATRGVPKNHPYYPLALAYEELFRDLRSIGVAGKDNTLRPVSEDEQLWNELVATGALDTVSEQVSGFLDQGFEFK